MTKGQRQLTNGREQRPLRFGRCLLIGTAVFFVGLLIAPLYPACEKEKVTLACSARDVQGLLILFGCFVALLGLHRSHSKRTRIRSITGSWGESRTARYVHKN